MKFLCLHGAFSSADSFSVLLAPLEQELGVHKVSLRYLDGPYEIKKGPDGYDAFRTWFGPPPHYRWIYTVDEEYQNLVSRLRCYQPGETAEDVIRYLRGDNYQRLSSEKLKQHTGKVFDFLCRILDEDPELEGILGYSEGAHAAATFILNEMQKAKRRIKCAIFFHGSPPFGPDGELVLADETELRIDIPTLHIVGANDPYKPGAVALYNVCDSRNSEFFDVAIGHTIPRSTLVVNELVEVIQDLVERTQG